MSNKKIGIKWTPFALSCLDEIHDYITFKEKSTKPADELIDSLFKKVDQLKEFPESGHPEPLLNAIGQDSRYLIKASYKIIYEYHSAKSVIIVTDVFHTSQNPDKTERTLTD